MEVKVVMQSPVTVIDIDAPLDEAGALMESRGLRQLAVSERGALAGFVSRRAVRRAQPSTLAPLDAYELPPRPGRQRVRDVVSRPLSVGSATSLAEAGSRLATHGADAVAVVEGREPVGLVTVRDLLGVIVQDAERSGRSGLGHILVAVDEQSPSTAMATALELARQHGAHLTLVRVLDPLPRRVITEIPSALMDEIDQRRRRAARAWLAAQAAETAEGGRADLVVVEGKLATEVNALAERREVDLIVVDASSAASLMAEAPCPVLGVPDGREARHAGR